MNADAFFVAFRIPNLLRRLFAEGSLSITFVPVFSEYLTNSGQHEAYQLARSAVRMLSALLILVTVAGVLLSPLIVRLIAPGFSATPGKLALTVTLTRMMFPYIFFIGLVALFMGILNVLGHFAAPALARIQARVWQLASLEPDARRVEPCDDSLISSAKSTRSSGATIGSISRLPNAVLRESFGQSACSS